MKIFLDANIFVAACGSDTGGSRYLFRVAEFDPTWFLLTSAYALHEARKNIQKKMPDAMNLFESLATHPSLIVVHPPSQTIIDIASSIIREKDAPIIAAAVMAQADVICTLDQKDFFTKKVIQFCSKHGISIALPGMLLQQWRDDQKRNHI